MKTRSSKSIMKHTFSEVPKANIQRSKFDRSHKHMTTFDGGLLVPIFVDDCLPGDTYSMSTTAFCRMATPIAPLMDNAKLTIHYWAVPYRLVWDNFQKFMGEQVDPGDSTDFLIPQVVYNNDEVYANTLDDYMGIPPQYFTPEGDEKFTVNAIWHRAYNLIYNENYRDQNLQDSVEVPRDDGPDADTLYKLLRRGKRHDYFTSCLPWPQKGPAVDLPLGESAPVISNENGIQVRSSLDSGDKDIFLTTANTLGWNGTGAVTPGNQALFGEETGLEVDLSGATAATINSLRLAFQLQKMLEKDARGGTRYTELIKSHFNVTSPDSRLQRPEYLGGGTINLTINPVAQTSSTDTQTPQGNLSGFGTIAGSGIGFKKSFTEHCVILGLACVDADLTYQQGLERKWRKRTKHEHYWPSLAHIGEQEVKQSEIYLSSDLADHDKTFGYQERYAEYRYFPSRISGKFRSSSGADLDIWHLAEFFESAPVLGSTFIQSKPPFDRVVAVPSEPTFIGDFYFRLKCDRPMPVYSVPGLIDHF